MYVFFPETAILYEFFVMFLHAQANSENLKMSSVNYRIESELLEGKNEKEKIQGENEQLRLKLERLQNKNRLLKDEKTEMLRNKMLLEAEFTEKSHDYNNVLTEMEEVKIKMQVSRKLFPFKIFIPLFSMYIRQSTLHC